MKATELLKEQHQEIDELFERIAQAERNELGALRDELVANLVAHSAIEREIFYPEGGKALGAAFQLQTALEEHALVEIMLQKLLSSELGDETFHARLDVLKELVQHHVEEEEQGLLTQAESSIDDERLEALGARMEGRFAEIREGDVRGLLASAIAKSMPAIPAGRRAQAGKAPARKAAAKRPPAKRAAAKRGEPARGTAARGAAARGAGARGAAKTRGAATGRKKAAAPAPAKTGRAAPSRKGASSRPAKSGRTGRKGGRTGSASTR